VTVKTSPLTPDLWGDLETVFGASGAYANCWCMWWRMPRKAFDAVGGDAKRAAFKAVVDDAAPPPGLLAYDATGAPVAWVALGPRSSYPTLQRSPTLKGVEDDGAWIATCFFVHKAHRGGGLIHDLIEAALAHAAAAGAPALLSIPRVLEEGARLPNGSDFVGTETVFAAHGFEVVSRPRPTRAVMRREL